jgi:hypothetical protein
MRTKSKNDDGFFQIEQKRNQQRNTPKKKDFKKTAEIQRSNYTTTASTTAITAQTTLITSSRTKHATKIKA